MLKVKQTAAAIALVLTTMSIAIGQGAANHANTDLTVTAAASSERVRITAPSDIVQMRLEVYGPKGEKFVDQEIKGGNVFDWHFQDGQAQRLAPGSYLCVVTAKNVSGKINQKLGTVVLTDGSASVQTADSRQSTAAQMQAIGPIEEGSSWQIAGSDLPQTPTLIAHDGTDGQMIRGRGALTFRVGNFFTGLDREQMRLTEDGNLGIGTVAPRAKLDVAGTIRAERILIGKPRTAEGNKFSSNAASEESDESVQPLTSGSGTQNRIAKWTDNSGTLGDAAMTELNGNVGIGTTSPGARVHVVGLQGSSGAGTFQLDTATLFSQWASTYPAFELLNANLTNNNVSLFQFSDAASGAAHAGIGAVNTNHASKFGDLFFFTKGNDGYQLRMGIYSGNVGIGTTIPSSKLDVSGGSLTVGTSATNKIFLDADSTGAYVQSNGSSPLRFYSGGTEAIRILNSGNVGIGQSNPQSKLDVTGDINVTGNAVVAGNIAAKYQDVAEWVPSRAFIPPATVVTLDSTLVNTVTPSSRAYDSRVAGVVSERPGVILGESGSGKVLIATTGRVRVAVDASRHPIEIGDLLVTGYQPGVAMKSVPIKIHGTLIHRPGTIIGKALEPLRSGRGSILVLLSLQ